MSYDDVVDMSGNHEFILRVAAAAAKADLTLSDPVAWARSYVWQVASLEGLDTAWAQARQESLTSTAVHPSLAKRSDLLTDESLDIAVRRVMGALAQKSANNDQNGHH